MPFLLRYTTLIKFQKIANAILFFCCLSAYAQKQVSFRQLSIKDGLSQNSAIAIAQDSTGFLWIATQDGINKYDGKKFEVYPYYFKDITSPNYSQLGKVYVDKEKKVWIIPSTQIPLFLDTESNSFKEVSGLKGVTSMYQDKDLTLWFGTYADGLYRLKKSTQKLEQVIRSEQLGEIFTITEDPDCNLWIASHGKIVKLSQNGKIHNFFPDGNEQSETNYSTLIFDKNNQQWVGTYGQGMWYRNRSDASFKRPNIFIKDANKKLHSVYVISMHLDRNNQLWVGTYGEGLFKIDLTLNQLNQFLPNKHDPTALHYKDILSIYEDYTGTLWFGTDGAGLSYYDPYLEKFNSFTNSQTPENVSIDVVRAISKDAQNTIWIGTSGKGLSSYNPMDDHWRTYLKDEATHTISSNRIMSLLSDSSEDLWIGTQEGGLNIKDKTGNFTVYNDASPIPFPDNTIWCMLEDEKGDKWIGTREKGLIKFDKKKGVLETYNTSPAGKNLPSNNIRALALGGLHTLWIATQDDGIAKLDLSSKKVTTYTSNPAKANTLASNHIKSLYYDPRGVLWIGTYGAGISALDIATNTCYTYNEEDGLANNVIYGILPDAENNLWLSSNKGITKFGIPDNWDEKPFITNYTNYDGLATEFNTGAYYKARNGELFFGGLDGYYWFNPSQVGINPQLPKTVITGLEIFNQPADLIPNATFKAKENTISFEFSSLQFSLPKKNQYQYSLEGHDPNWISSGNTHMVRYTNLSPGAYTFKVKSSNYDGLWNPKMATYSFTILKPWYNSTEAWMGYVLFFILGLYLTYAYFKWRWDMQWRLKNQEDEAHRLKELDSYKTKLYTNLSHEFRTPLTLIAAPIKKNLQDHSLSPQLQKDLRMIDQNSNQLLSLVDELLELSFLESGTVKLHIEKGDVAMMLRASAACFVPLAEKKSLRFEYRITEIKEAWYDVDVLYKIVNNLLSNAIKYCPFKGKVSFNAFRTSTLQLRLEVTNDLEVGQVPDIHTLFNRFYQVDQNADGFGIGLSLIKELTKLNHGFVDVHLVATNRIQFIVELPIQKSDFEATEIKEAMAVAPDSEHIHPMSTSQPPEKEKAIILIIEDQKDLQNFIAELFQDHFSIITANDGRTGIEKALQFVPDLIVSDIMMPIVSGIEVCNVLKEDERTSHIPIILLTAKTSLQDEIEGIKTGADDYITKPFHPEKLKARVKNLIGIRKQLQKNYEQNVILRHKKVVFTPIDEQFLIRAQKIMDENIFESDFNASQFSKALGMSRMQLHRKLIALTGLSTSSFIRSQRLKSAAQMLKNSKATIAEVSYSTGFNTPSYFIKCFKEVYGKTPAEYLQKKA